MWVFIYFDLPTDTKADRANYREFRKNLLSDGFEMFQFSIYARHCMSRQHADKHIRRVKAYLPERGDVMISCMTDKQFGMITFYKGKSLSTPATEAGDQLTLF